MPLTRVFKMAGINNKSNQKDRNQSKYISTYLDSGFGSDVDSQMSAETTKGSDGGKNSLHSLIEGLWADIEGLQKTVTTLKTTVDLQARQIHELEVKGKDRQTHCHCSSGTIESAPTQQHLPSPIETSSPQPQVSQEVHSKHIPTARKRLLFPKLEDSITFNQYVLSVSSCIGAFRDMGHDDRTIADDLYQCLIQGECSAEFLHQLSKRRRKGLLSTADIVSALRQCDPETALRSPWERFENLRKPKKEKLSGFLMRCEQYSHDVPFLNENPEVQQWHIKMQFLKGARIPEKMHDKLLPFTSLSEFLLACKRLLQQDKVQPKPLSKSEEVRSPWNGAGNAASSINHQTASQISLQAPQHHHHIKNTKSSSFPSLLSFKPTMLTPLMANFQSFL